jgi:SNF2 family DNA or RNA helicase
VPPLSLMQHQVKALEKARGKPFFAYLMEMGTGKSLVACTEMLGLAGARFIDSLLVVAPKGSYEDWATKHLPEAGLEIYDARVYVWRGQGTKGERAEYDELMSYGGFRVMIVNVEALSQPKGRAARAAARFVEESKPCAMIVDESTTIKNYGAKRTQAVMDLGDACVVRRILTGSPVTNSPMDIFSQFEFLKPNLLGFRSYYAFRHRYAILREIEHGGRKFQIPVGFKNLEELREKVAVHSFRVLKEECLDLKPKTYATYNTQMSERQLEVYESVRDNAMAQLDSMDYVSATSVITKLVRLHQISCGFVVDENDAVHELSDNRIQDLLHLCEETEDSVVVWSCYRFDIARIAAALRKQYGPSSVVEYHGGVDQNERETGRRNFQDGTARFFVGNVQTGGRGIGLYRSHTTVYYSNNWDLELRQQSEDRTHRLGQSDKCFYIDLVAPGTVDEKIIRALRKKINIATTINGDNYREWLI